MNDSRDRQSIVEEITRQLRSLRAMHARQQPREPWLDVDLTMKQIKILFVLAANGPQRSNALAASVGISAASATGVFDRLEHQGYVVRSDDALDRRAVVVQLSESGAKVVADLQLAGQEHLHELLNDLTDDDLDALRRGFVALVAAAEARTGAASLPAASGGCEAHEDRTSFLSKPRMGSCCSSTVASPTAARGSSRRSPTSRPAEA